MNKGKVSDILNYSAQRNRRNLSRRMDYSFINGKIWFQPLETEPRGKSKFLGFKDIFRVSELTRTDISEVASRVLPPCMETGICYQTAKRLSTVSFFFKVKNLFTSSKNFF